MTYDAALRNALVDELLEVRRVRGSIPESLVRVVADDAGVNRSTLRRWVKEADEDRGGPVAQRRHIDELADEHIDVVYEHFGNLAQAKRYLDKEFDEIAAMSYSTFRLLWLKTDPGVRAMAVGGGDAFLATQLRTAYSAPSRNAIWHVDAMECPIWVVPDGCPSERVKPWMITVLDDHSRRIMAAVLTMQRPNSRDAVVAVADAMRIRVLSDGVKVGGVPDVVHTDNGNEFKNKVLSQGLRLLGVKRTFSYPYLKHLNGKVERVQLTMQRQLIATLPDYSEGPRTISRRDIFGLEAGCLGWAAFLEYVFAWVDDYNATHAHSALEGRTPNQVWSADTSPIREVDPERVRLAMLEETRPRKVQPRGVRFENCWYTAPELASIVDQKVRLRHMPHDDSFVEVFFEGEWLATAYPHDALTDEQRRTIRDQNRRQYEDAREHSRRAAERRDLIAAESGGEVIVTTGRRPDADEVSADELFLELNEAPPNARGGADGEGSDDR